ncbi:MAG: FHA domain-containing protein [Armatimonadota bacterium]|nr:FHA domain-containing protein [Armatimonadota bacterium]
MKRIISQSCSPLFPSRSRSGQLAAIILFALFAASAVTVHGQAAGGKPSAPTAAPVPAAGKDKGTGVQKTPAAQKPTPAVAADAPPAGNGAPAAGKDAAAATPANAGDTVKVQLPDGQYLVWITQGGLSSMQTLVQTRSPVSLTCPGTGPVKLWVIDPATDRLAVVNSTPNSDVSVTTSSFTQAARVTVHLEDKDKKPLDFATVTLTAGGQPQTQQLTPMDGGVLSFSGVPLGPVEVKAARPDGSASDGTDISKTENSDASSIDLPIQMTVASTLPVTSPSGPTDETAGAGADPLASMTSGGSRRGQMGSSASGTAKQTAVTPSGVRHAAPPASHRALYLMALLLLAILAVAGIWGARNPDRLRVLAGPWLDRLGIKFPGGDDPVPSAHSPAHSPDTVLSASTCAFCGTRKDPVTGSCACTLVPAGVKASAGSSLSATAPLTAGSVAGPRFITLDGPVTGQVFSVAAESSIGRDTTNTIALAEDTAVSRRHARVSPDAGQIEIIDEGSSNGTFVNGSRVDRQVLHPTDEILIGHSLFRFEV